MKKILILINLLLALPILAQAQNGGWQIPPGANTPRAANTPGTPMNRANVDIWGNQLVGLQAGTAAATNPVKLEDVASASGDAGIGVFGVRNDTAAALTGTNADYGFPVVNQYGGVVADLDIRFQGNGTSSRSPIRAEDGASSSGDAIIGVGGVRNEGGSTLADSNLDYSFFGVNRFGGLFVEISSDKQFAGNSTGLLKPEDSVPGSGDAGIVPLVRGIGTGSLAPSAGTSGDYEWQNNDSDGRLFVNPYGANPGQWFQACGTATATTADVAIKSAAGASTRNYITGITCSNSSATTATNINFKDGSTVIAVGGVNQMATTSSGAFTATFPVPLRGTANTAFNFNTAVSVSSVICCAVGYTSANS